MRIYNYVYNVFKIGKAAFSCRFPPGQGHQTAYSRTSFKLRSIKRQNTSKLQKVSDKKKIKKKYLLNRDKNNLSFKHSVKRSFRYRMALTS